MLSEIRSPADIKGLSYDQLNTLAEEIRGEIIDVVSKNGGHLASNLGIVEATIALHKTFDSPKDKIVFDVGHQCYAHKLLTGRYETFGTLRSFGGVSGFLCPAESEHDVLYEGHCGTSVSAALGIAKANAMEGNDRYAVAVVGDGAFTNGMIFEALNNCADKQLRLVILLNDNEMSISRNVGGVSEYFSRIRTSKKYFTFKRRTEKALLHIPLLGKGMYALTRWFKQRVKRLVAPDNIFENLGLDYLGPLDGNDIEKVCEALEEAKRRKHCCIVHIRTKKGRGYPFAEKEPDKYHGTGAFDKEKGWQASGAVTFSDVFGEIVCRAAEQNDKVCAITAAMCEGTGLKRFAETHPDRFFDVGIAEEHAVTFAGGLAVRGFLPVCALYSTFSQRSFDQVFHDVALQGLPMILALDRCGFVPSDGVTHQGIFDVALFSSLPRVEIYSPENFDELRRAFASALASQKVTIVRYPKGGEEGAIPPGETVPFRGEDADGKSGEDAVIKYLPGTDEKETVVISYGKIASEAYAAAKNRGAGFIKLVKIFPLDEEGLFALTKSAKFVYVAEEGILSGGIGEKIASAFARAGKGTRVKVRAAEGFASHGTREDLLRSFGLTAAQMSEELSEETGDL